MIFFWTVKGRFIKSSNHVMNGLTHDDRPPVLDEPPKKRAKVTSGAQLSPSWEVDQVSRIKKDRLAVELVDGSEIRRENHLLDVPF